MTFQKCVTILLNLQLPWQSRKIPALSSPLCCPPTSFYVFLLSLLFFYLPLHNFLGHASGSLDMTLSSEFVLLHYRKEIVMLLNCNIDLGTNFLICHMVFISDIQKPSKASHVKCLDSSFKFCY